MQIKTIEKIVRQKMIEWVTTIDDLQLGKDVLNNLLVSGGSICSLLLNQQVNDFDVYLQDINVLKRLMEYYAKPFQSQIRILDGREKEKLVDELNEAYKGVADEEEGIERRNRYACILRNLKEDQLKFEFPGVGFKPEYPEPIEERKYKPIYFSPNAISLSDQLQIVVRFWGNPEQIHSTFDFVHATNYFTMEDGLVRNLQAMESIITKQLYYQGSHYPLTSIIRAKKFIKRDFNISAGEYLKIMFQISKLNLEDPDELFNQLCGVDVAYFEGIINVLQEKRDKDPNFVPDSKYLNTLIDRMFNGDSSPD
mgnify:CR=1 FL=1